MPDRLLAEKSETETTQHTPHSKTYPPRVARTKHEKKPTKTQTLHRRRWFFLERKNEHKFNQFPKLIDIKAVRAGTKPREPAIRNATITVSWPLQKSEKK